MAFRRYIIPIVLFVLVVGVAFGTMVVADAASDDAAREPVQVTNETISQQTGIWQFVKNATVDSTAGFNESVTAYNASGAELVKGVDYEWNASDGTIQYIDTANVTDGATGNISYIYFKNTPDVQVLSQIIDPIVTLVSHSPLLVGGLALGLMLLAAAAILARYMGGSDFTKTNR